jgi:glycosyltransferase involved in cell wall biosynthesis
MSTLSPVRTLFVTMMVHPPLGGTHLRNWQNVSLMKQLGPVGVFSIFNRSTHYPDTSGLAFCQHYNIHDYRAPAILLERAIHLLRRKGLRYYWSYVSIFAKALKAALQEFQPDLVLIEELGLYPYLPIVQSYGCPIIFDNHNVEASLYEDTQCSRGDLKAWVNRQLYLPQLHRAELRFSQECHQVWVCSQQDTTLLKQRYALTTPCYVIPNSIDVNYYEFVYPPQVSAPEAASSAPQDLLFLGSFGHSPNADAAKQLIEQIFPPLKRLYPDCRLLLVGSRPTQEMLEAAKRDRHIIVTGEVPDVRPYLASASIMVVPLRKGSGTRFKILEAFASRLPVVSTTKGAEGLNVRDSEHLLIRDSTEAIVEAASILWDHPSLGKELAISAFQLVREHYSWEAAQQKAKLAIQDLFIDTDLNQIRLKQLPTSSSKVSPI